MKGKSLETLIEKSELWKELVNHVENEFSTSPSKEPIKKLARSIRRYYKSFRRGGDSIGI